MEKKNKKISLTEMLILIIVLISAALILIDLAVNLLDEINLQMQSSAGNIVLPITAQILNLIPV